MPRRQRSRGTDTLIALGIPGRVYVSGAGPVAPEPVPVLDSPSSWAHHTLAGSGYATGESGWGCSVEKMDSLPSRLGLATGFSRWRTKEETVAPSSFRQSVSVPFGRPAGRVRSQGVSVAKKSRTSCRYSALAGIGGTDPIKMSPSFASLRACSGAAGGN